MRNTIQMMVTVVLLLSFVLLIKAPNTFNVYSNYNSCEDGTSACCSRTGCSCNCNKECNAFGWCTISCDPCSGCSGNPDPACGGRPVATNTPRPQPTSTPIPEPTSPPGCDCYEWENVGDCGEDGCSGTQRLKECARSSGAHCSYSRQCRNDGACTTDTSIPFGTATPIPQSSIQGYKVKMPGNIHTPPNSVSNETITLDSLQTSTNNPYSFANLTVGTYQVTASQPALNYSIGYSLCNNTDSCHTGPITMGTSVSVNAAPTYMSLWWHYWEYVGWYRLKQASFNKQTAIVNFIPPDVIPYDSWDTDEELLNIRQATDPEGVGLITSAGTIDVGPNNTNASAKNWTRQNYISSKGYLANLPSFIAYAKARKNVHVITTINDLQSDKVNIITTANLALQDNTINPARDNFVLIVEGDVTIESAPANNFNQARQSWAIISTGKINVNPTITEMNGIFIANSFDLAYGTTSSSTPLKIVGNLISNTPITDIKRNRQINDYRQASLYVVFFPKFYADLTPHLSTIIQDGRQFE